MRRSKQGSFPYTCSPVQTSRPPKQASHNAIAHAEKYGHPNPPNSQQRTPKLNDEQCKHTETAYVWVMLKILKRKLTFGYTWSERKKNNISDAEM